MVTQTDDTEVVLLDPSKFAAGLKAYAKVFGSNAEPPDDAAITIEQLTEVLADSVTIMAFPLGSIEI